MKKSASKSRSKKSVIRRNPSLSTKPRGVSKIIILAIVAILLAVGGGIYVFSQSKSLGGSLQIGRPALNPNCEQNDPELCKFLNNWAIERSYSMTTTSSMGGMNIESVMKIAGTGRVQMISKQNGKETSNTISIDDTTYTLDYSDNKWWKQTYKAEMTDTDTSTDEMKDEIAIDDELAQDNTKYTFVMKEACGSLTCFKYLIDIADPSGMKQHIWFDDRDYLVRKISMDDGKGNKSESVYDYENVSVNEPSPTKEGTPDMGAGMQYSEEEARKMMEQYQQTEQSTDYTSETPIENPSSEEF